MRHSIRAVLATAVFAVALAGAATSASANTLSLNSSTFRFAWRSLELHNTAGLGATVRCPLTFEGTFHSAAIQKVARSLIGLVTAASVSSSCTGGSMTIKRETLPWHLQYASFTGTLPNITEVSFLLLGMGFEIRNEAGTCNARTEAGHPAGFIASLAAGGAITGVEGDSTKQIELTGGLCGLARGWFTGSGTATQQGSEAGVTIKLGPLVVTLEPSPVEFGTVEPEEVSRRTVTVSVNSEATISSIGVVAGNYFAITDPNRCVGRRLAERGTCSFRALFVAPSEARTRVEDTLIVETTIGDGRATLRGATS